VKNKRSRRIRTITGPISSHEVIDNMAFIKNKCSNNARKILTILESVEVDLYFDKHYFVRYQYGDDNGKRHGIEMESVQNLILEATKHLIFYSITLKAFSFLNFLPLGYPQRIVLTKLFKEEISLNVIVEYHCLSMQKFEVTLITAMRKYDFHFNDGTHQLEMQVDGTSILHKNERGKILSVGDCYKLQDIPK